MKHTVKSERRLSDMRNRDFLNLQPVPHDEECTEAGGNWNDQEAECNAMINQFIRTHGEPPPGATFCIVSNEHDFGTYYDTAIIFDPESETHSDYAYKIEGNGSINTWDNEALAELKEAGHSKHRFLLRKLKAA